MSNPIRVTYVYNCTCDDLGGPEKTTRPYPIEALDAVDVSASIVGGELLNLYFFLTSRLYPIENLDAADSSANSVRGQMLTEPLDAVDSAAQIQSGVLQQLLKSYNEWEPDAVDTSAQIQSGVLQQLLKSYNANFDVALPDAVDTSAQITGGELRPELIETTMLPDAVDVSAATLSGSLE